MARYYYIDTSGEDTNLQLYALKQAKLQWSSLERDLAEHEHVQHFHERCVYLICTMGLSVTQLLGQNNPEPSDRVPSPNVIFQALLERYGLDPELKNQFKDFIDTYDQCRHFGLTNDGKRHWQVSQVTLDRTRTLYEFGLFVWEIVIELFRQDPQSELDELDLANIENQL